MINVLIFPSGSLVAREIHESLKYEKNVCLYGTDNQESNPSSFYFERYIPHCPFIKEEERTIEFLKNIVIKHSIKYIYPAFDSVIRFLKINEDKIGATVIAPSVETIDICDSKKKTYETLEDIIPVPKIYSNTDLDICFPLYCKPITGYGSRDHQQIVDKDMLLKVDTTRYLLSEVLTGSEYTVDCFTNLNGKLLYVSGRKRDRTLNGISVYSYTVDDIPEFQSYAELIQQHIPMRGAWFFQVKYDRDGTLKLLEIACRIPGAMCVSRVRGVNFPMLTILDYEHCNVDPIHHNTFNVECHKIYSNYYKTSNLKFDNVYCDLDDTIIIKNKINTELITFLYKCIGTKKIILITRNSNYKEVLDRYRLHIFDEHIQLSKDKYTSEEYIEKKSKYIQDNSIFIDDSYIERKDVHNAICFSPSDIEFLQSYV
jgi:hypothetical protein